MLYAKYRTTRNSICRDILNTFIAYCYSKAMFRNFRTVRNLYILYGTDRTIALAASEQTNYCKRTYNKAKAAFNKSSDKFEKYIPPMRAMNPRKLNSCISELRSRSFAMHLNMD